MTDDFTERYRELLTGWYDCVDRIVLNACSPMGSTAGGFRTWWRRLVGGGDAEADAVLDSADLMRLAGRFARRVRAWAADNAVPVIECAAGEPKHLVAEEYLGTHPAAPGVFLILVAKAPAMVGDVRRSADGTVIGGLARKRTYVNHYSLHIMDRPGAPGDQDVRACAVRRAGDLERHEYVAIAAQGEGAGFVQGGELLHENWVPGGHAAASPGRCGGNLTVFKVHFGLLTLKGCTKGARVLVFEAITHSTRQLGCGRALGRFAQIAARLAGMCQRFCTALDCADIGFIPGGTLDQLPLPAQAAPAGSAASM
jgi:hypothetical protein